MALLAALAIVVLAAAADMTGNWEVEFTFDDSNVPGGGIDCAFKQDGERLTGNCSGGTASLTGEVKGQDVTWRMTAGNPPATFTGRLDETGTSLKGRFAVGGMGGRFAAVKQ